MKGEGGEFSPRGENVSLHSVAYDVKAKEMRGRSLASMLMPSPCIV